MCWCNDYNDADDIVVYVLVGFGFNKPPIPIAVVHSTVSVNTVVCRCVVLVHRCQVCACVWEEDDTKMQQCTSPAA